MLNTPPGYLGSSRHPSTTKPASVTAVSFTPTPAHRYAFEHSNPGSRITHCSGIVGLWATIACSMRPPACHPMLCLCDGVPPSALLLILTQALLQLSGPQHYLRPALCILTRSFFSLSLDRLPQTWFRLPFGTLLFFVQEAFTFQLQEVVDLTTPLPSTTTTTACQSTTTTLTIRQTWRPLPTQTACPTVKRHLLPHTPDTEANQWRVRAAQ